MSWQIKRPLNLSWGQLVTRNSFEGGQYTVGGAGQGRLRWEQVQGQRQDQGTHTLE